MAINTENWARAYFKTYLCYLGAGVAAVPVGICYGYVATHGMENRWSVLAILVVALGLAHFGYTWVGKLVEAEQMSGVRGSAIAGTMPQSLSLQTGGSGSRGGALVIGSAAMFAWLILGFWFLLAVRNSH